jgi:glycosyltransferase involved in cell wall biosynthesis
MRRPIAVIDSSAEIGGAELSLLPVVARLAQRRHVVAFLPRVGPMSDRLRAAGAELRAGLRIEGALAQASGHYGVTSRAALAGAAMRQQTRLAAALLRLRPATVYCNGFRAQVAATVPARAAGARVAWHVRDFGEFRSLGGTWARLARLADLVIANSAATAGQPALAKLSARVLAVPNGVDLELFRAREREPDGPPTIGMASNLTPWKGHRRFLRVLATVREQAPEVRGRIAGRPIYDTAGHRDFPDELRAEIQALGLEGACALEALDYEDMPEWLTRLTALVHCPERPEPFGRILAEAMAVGVPVIGVCAGAVAEVLGSAGVLVEADADDRRVAAAVVDLLRDPARRRQLAAEGRRRAARHFDEAAYATRVADEILALR